MVFGVSGSMRGILVPVDLNGGYIMHSNGEEESDDDVIIVHEEIADRRSENKNGTVKANQSSNCHSLTNNDVQLQGNLKSEEINIISVYKPPGCPDAIKLTTVDVLCLSPGGLLNDSIINFYLKYLYYEKLTDYQRHATHLFNVFFYTRLTFEHPSTKINTEEVIHARHTGVARWTCGDDIFSKDFIIIPINEQNFFSGHWIVVIVCYPWMVGMLHDVHADEDVDWFKLKEEFSDVDHIEFPQNVDLSTNYEECVDKMPIDDKGEAFNRWRKRRLAWLRKNGYNPKYVVCLLMLSVPVHFVEE
uniref:Ubiquitin-like protease family profile domain-containing protein n=1 Tax=Trichobilharzia regenti TaxID=157069 RepID=A0AA85JBG3_TRIRE|nr:unnamed protein product [Trichobilharzia regenti]